MRIWSIHPKYLDSKGLVALWRETLLAKHVLEGKTSAYKHHPQLTRFTESTDPIVYINHYLISVYDEAVVRGYNFDRNKINVTSEPGKLTVSVGQVIYETEHLLNKLSVRDIQRFDQFKAVKLVKPHPLFVVVDGDIAKWERI